MDPGSDRGKATVEQVVTREEFQLGSVVVVGGPHRADHGDVVDQFSGLGPPVADLGSALATRPVPLLQRQHPGLFGLDDVVEYLLADVAVVGRLDDGIQKRGLGKCLPRVAIQRRLGIEPLVMTRATTHHQPDHRLGPCREMWSTGRVRTMRPRGRLGQQVATDHRIQGNSGQAHPGPTQQLAPCRVVRGSC